MELTKEMLKFDVSLLDDIQELTPTLSKGRVRIFYKGMNRNSTYISEDFAQQLIASLPYAPVKGIFDTEEQDFTDHGTTNAQGKIYGVVLADPNFAWEEHMDIDGVIRTYACADIVLFTGLYPEAKMIKGKSQSMEIFKDTLVGEWRTTPNGDPYYYFISGCLVGLQALGDSTEPCFEGAAFFKLYENITEIVNYIKKIENKEGREQMEKELFRLSDSEKAFAIQEALNTNFNEEGGWKQDALVLDVYDDYAICMNLDSGKYQRAYYTKDGDSISIGDIVDVFVVDVTAEEMTALEMIKAATGTYEAAATSMKELNEKVEELSTSVQTLESEKETFAAKITEMEGTIAEFEADKKIAESTLQEKEAEIANYAQKIQEFESEKVEKETAFNDLLSETETLRVFKKAAETEKKAKILEKYEDFIDEAVCQKLKETIDTFTIDEFKKEVCTAAVESSPGIFAEKPEQVLVYTGHGEESRKPVTGVEKILNKYKKNGGN